MNQDLSKFGTAEFPLHSNGLSIVVKCPWRAVMLYMYGEDGESGPAADTGSAVHKAAAAMHNGAEPAAALKVMGERAHEYPRADLREAAGIFLSYSSDERNRVECLLVERQVEFRLAAAPEDPTGEPVVIVGRVDQVRLYEGDRASVWDIKTSKLDGIRLLQESTMQVAAYCVGASYLLGRRVDPGGLILPRRYVPGDPSRSPVFWHIPWKFEDAAQILEPVRHVVAHIRRGQLWHVPSDEMCRWCSARSPDICLPKLQQTLALIRRDVDAPAA